MTQIWHVTFATTGRTPLAEDEQQRRLLVRTLARVVGRWTVLFCFVDDHLHLVLLCRAECLGRLCASVYRALVAINPAIETGEPTPVENRGHMMTLVLRSDPGLAPQGRGRRPSTVERVLLSGSRRRSHPRFA